jgi:ATP-dependent Lon protease
MTRDQNKIVKKEQNKASKKRDEALRRRKNNEESSDDGEPNSSDSESDEMDQHEYRKFLSKMFPSKHAKDKVKAGEKLKKTLRNDQKNDQKKKNKKDESEEDDEEDIDDSESDSDYVPKKSKSKKNNKKGQSSRLRRKVYEIEESEEEDDDDDITLESEDESEDFETEETEDEDDDVDESEEDEEVKPKRRSKKSDKFNIVLTIGNGVNREEELEDEYAEFFDEEDWETCSDDDAETENEDDPISSDSDSEEEEEEEELPKKKKGSNKKVEKKETSKKDKVVDKKKSETENIKLVTTEKTTDAEVQNKLLEVLNGLKDRGENTSLVNECIKVCNQKMEVDKKKTEKKLQKEKDRNDRIFKRILRDKNTMNDFEFFEKMDVVSQKKIIKELREINKLTRIEKPYRLTLLEADIPVVFKGAAMKRVASLRYMEPGSGEYYKIKTWVDTFMRIPFSKYQSLPISIEDGVEKCHDFMADAQKTLDNAVYGLNDAKMQIMQMLGQLITNPKAIGTAIAIHGPPGTGKTSLVKEGISKILNRPFSFIALGGATDSSFLEGHSYTYEGSLWGKIVQILIDSKCMNPVIYFDELDKISETPKGEEIAGILTHLTDTSQNSQFHDKYFADIDFDLSKCLFIFSYNDESKVNPILKDRMYRIKTAGYNQKQKTAISNNYLLPKIREQIKFSKEDIIIPDATINYIIDSHCGKEDGVRNLKRCLEIIYTKLNLYRLMKPGSNLFEEDMSLKVEFPFTVTKDIVDKLIKNSKDPMSSALYSLYA